MGWRRGQAYGQDLRDRVLALADAPVREVAARFGVSPSYVVKARARRRTLGQTTPGPQRNHVPSRLGCLHEALQARVAATADATLAELRAWTAAEHGVSVSHKVMWKTLRRLGLTLKKSRNTQPSRNAQMLPKRAQPGERARTG
jgi:transposase